MSVKLTKRKESEYFEARMFRYEKYRYLSIIYVDRLDDYDSICRTTIFKLGLDPLYCLCDPQSLYSKSAYNNTKP